MRGDPASLAPRAAELREAFDRSFAEATRPDAEARVDLLAIRLAGDAYALSLAEVAGLFVDRVIVPLPTLVPELLGIAGVRGALVPVYDLRALLGRSGGDDPRWMVSTAGAPSIGLVFDHFEQHLRVPPAALAPEASGSRGFVRQIARAGEGVWPLIHLPSVLEAIKVRAQSTARPKER